MCESWRVGTQADMAKRNTQKGDVTAHPLNPQHTVGQNRRRGQLAILVLDVPVVHLRAQQKLLSTLARPSDASGAVLACARIRESSR